MNISTFIFSFIFFLLLSSSAHADNIPKCPGIHDLCHNIHFGRSIDKDCYGQIFKLIEEKELTCLNDMLDKFSEKERVLLLLTNNANEVSLMAYRDIAFNIKDKLLRNRLQANVLNNYIMTEEEFERYKHYLNDRSSSDCKDIYSYAELEKCSDLASVSDGRKLSDIDNEQEISCYLKNSYEKLPNEQFVALLKSAPEHIVKKLGTSVSCASIFNIGAECEFRTLVNEALRKKNYDKVLSGTIADVFGCGAGGLATTLITFVPDDGWPLLISINCGTTDYIDWQKHMKPNGRLTVSLTAIKEPLAGDYYSWIAGKIEP